MAFEEEITAAIAAPTEEQVPRMGRIVLRMVNGRYAVSERRPRDIMHKIGDTWSKEPETLFLFIQKDLFEFIRSISLDDDRLAVKKQKLLKRLGTLTVIRKVLGYVRDRLPVVTPTN